MKNIYFSLIILLLWQSSISQTTVVLTADKDNTIYSSFTGNSNGAGQYLFVGQNAAANNNSVQRALLHFNTATIPAGATITAATLTIYTNKTAPNATGIELHKVNSDWGEGTSDAAGNEASGAPATTGDATWSQRMFPSTSWSVGGGDFVAASSGGIANVEAGIGSVTALTISGAALVAVIQSWINTPASNFGWAIISNDEQASASVKRLISRNSTTVAQRPSISITYTAVLPVTLRQFSGAAAGKQVNLKWQTVNEINNHHFAIEHSTDGTNFNSVGTVNASTNASVVNNYTFTHVNLAPGNHYYRLAQYDLDNKVTYSQTIFLATAANGGIKIVPNPAVSVISITTSYSLQGANFEIYSVGGQAIRKGTLNSQQLDISSLTPGQYLISIVSQSGETSKQMFTKKY